MKTIITGASGLVGRAVVRELLKNKHSVYAICRNPIDLSVAGKIQWIKCNLLDGKEVQTVFERLSADTLIHCAWETRPNYYRDAKENLQWIDKTIAITRVFQKNGGKRLVCLGTSEEYNLDYDFNLSEESDLLVNNLYSASKSCLFRILQEWSIQTGIQVAWARLFCVFGENENSARLFPRIIGELLTGKTMEFDSGEATRDFLSASQVGSAIACLAESNLVGAINIASGEAVRIRQVVESIVEHLAPRGQVIFSDKQLHIPSRIVADVGRLQHELKWTPNQSLFDQIGICARWYKSNLSIFEEL